MKEIKTRSIFTPLSMEDLGRKLDNDITGVQCYHCGMHTRFHEAYINEHQRQDFEMMVRQYNELLEDMNEAILSIYGDDPRRINFINKMNQLRENFLKPKLRGV